MCTYSISGQRKAIRRAGEEMSDEFTVGTYVEGLRAALLAAMLFF